MLAGDGATGTGDGEITITVSNPEKVGEGMGAYLVYTVTVKVSVVFTQCIHYVVYVYIISCALPEFKILVILFL